LLQSENPKTLFSISLLFSEDKKKKSKQDFLFPDENENLVSDRNLWKIAGLFNKRGKKKKTSPSSSSSSSSFFTIKKSKIEKKKNYFRLKTQKTTTNNVTRKIISKKKKSILCVSFFFFFYSYSRKTQKTKNFLKNQNYFLCFFFYSKTALDLFKKEKSVSLNQH
jgi:hypothetical protein